MAIVAQQPEIVVAAAAAVQEAEKATSDNAPLQVTLKEVARLAASMPIGHIRAAALTLVSKEYTSTQRVVLCLSEILSVKTQGVAQLYFAVIDALRVTRQYSLLRSLGHNCVDAVLPKLLDPRNQKVSASDEECYVQLTARVLISSIDFSLELISKTALMCLKQMNTASPALLRTLEDVMTLIGDRLEVLDQEYKSNDTSHSFDFSPQVAMEQLDSLRRACSWVIPDSPSKGRRFGLYDLPWPEGKWLLQGEPNQGKVPEFSFSAHSLPSSHQKLDNVELLPYGKRNSSPPTISGHIMYSENPPDVETEFKTLLAGSSRPRKPWTLIGTVKLPQQARGGQPLSLCSMGAGSAFSGVLFEGSCSRNVLGSRVHVTEKLAFGTRVEPGYSAPASTSLSPLHCKPCPALRHHGSPATVYPWVDLGAPFSTPHEHPFTWECWIRPQVPSDERPMTVMANGNFNLQCVCGAGSYSLSVRQPSGELLLETKPAAIPRGFVHVAFSSTGTEVRLHEDGRLVAAAAGTRSRRPVDSSTPLYVGACPVGAQSPGGPAVAGDRVRPSSHFLGAVCEVRLWRVCLSADQLAVPRVLHGFDLLHHRDALRGYFPLLHSPLLPDRLLQNRALGPGGHAALRWAAPSGPTACRGWLWAPAGRGVPALREAPPCPLPGHLDVAGEVLLGGAYRLPQPGPGPSGALPVALGDARGGVGSLWSRKKLTVGGGVEVAVDAALLPSADRMAFTLWLCSGSQYDLRVLPANDVPSSGKAAWGMGACVAVTVQTRLREDLGVLTVSVGTVRQAGGASDVPGASGPELEVREMCAAEELVVCPVAELEDDPVAHSPRLQFGISHVQDRLALQVTVSRNGATFSKSVHSLACSLGDWLEVGGAAGAAWVGLSVGGAAPGMQLLELQVRGRVPVQGPVPVPVDAPDPLLGSWVCICTTANPPERLTCRVCETPKPGAGANDGSWSCSFCTAANDPTRTMCGVCGKDRPKGGGQDAESSSWSCTQCTAHNDAARTMCSVCGGDRVSDPQGSEPTAWNCSVCTFENPSTNSKCGMCEKPKPTVDQVTAHVASSSSESAVEQIGTSSPAPNENVSAERMGYVQKLLKRVASRELFGDHSRLLESGNDFGDHSHSAGHGDTFDASGVWDTTLGAQIEFVAEGSEPEKSVCMIMDGWYGKSKSGHMIASAVANQKGWKVQGTWEQWRKDEENDMNRLGGHLFEYDVEGSSLKGNWWFGSGLHGEWTGERVHDSTLIRGLDREVSLKKTGLGLGVHSRLAQAQKDQSLSSKQTTPGLAPFATGLVNMEDGLTNVCYQNALIQCLFNTRQFRALVLHAFGASPNGPNGQQLEHKLSGDPGDGPLPSGHPILESVEFVRQLRKVMAHLLLSQSPRFATKDLQTSLASEWTMGRQMDASDFCHLVMKASEEAADAGSGEANAVSALFSCKVAQVMRCTRCDHTSSHFERALGLAAPLPRLYGPITDVLAVACHPGADEGDPGTLAVPEGFQRIPVNLNAGKLTAPRVYLCVRRDPDAAPVTELIVRAAQPSTPPPAGYTAVPGDLNPGGAQSVHMFCKREARGSPITDLHLLSGDADPPAEFRRVSVDVNPGGAPVHLCYRRGMPLTDVAIGARPPSNGADYLLVDVPLNPALARPDGEEVFLWSSDSRGPPPLTALALLSAQDARAREAAGQAEVCWDAPLAPGEPGGAVRYLVKERGQGCPVTQVAAFRAPLWRSRFRHPEVCALLGPGARRGLEGAPWLPVPASQATPAPPPGLMEPRGNQLRLERVSADQRVEAALVRGRCSALEHATLGGVALRRGPELPWLVYARLDQLLPAGAAARALGTRPSSKIPGVRDFVQLEVRGDGTVSGFRVDTSQAAPARRRLQGGRARAAEPRGGLAQLSVLREGEQMPGAFERVRACGEAGETNINAGSGAGGAWLIARRCRPGEAPLVDVKVFIAELEPPPEGMEVVEATHAGGSADLNLGTGGPAMYLCVRRATAREAQGRPRALDGLQLQWKDRGEVPGPGFKDIRYSASLATEANLCATGGHSLFLCARYSRTEPPLVSNGLNGVYHTDLLGDLNLYAVSPLVPAQVVMGKQKANVTAGGAQMEGVLLEEQLEPPFDPLPGATTLDKVIKGSDRTTAKGPRTFYGFWINTKTTEQLETFCTMEFDDDLRTAAVNWSWGLDSGSVAFVKDDFLEISPVVDYGEYWADGKLEFSDRCCDSSVQTVVERFCSTTILGGANRPQCDSATCGGSVQTHEQHTVVVDPPSHLQVSVKRMGYDWKNNHAVKELTGTPFETVLRLPHVPRALEGQVGLGGAEGARDRTYVLYGLVVHAGQRANSGHYFSYCRDSSATDLWKRDSELSPWVLCNDTRVTRCTWDQLVATVSNSDVNNTYLLFYRMLTPEEESAMGEVAPAPRGLQVPLPAVSYVDDPLRPQQSDPGEEDEEAMLALALAMSQEGNPAVQADEVTGKELAAEEKETLARKLELVSQTLPQWFREVEDENLDIVFNQLEPCTSPFFRLLVLQDALEKIATSSH